MVPFGFSDIPNSRDYSEVNFSVLEPPKNEGIEMLAEAPIDNVPPSNDASQIDVNTLKTDKTDEKEIKNYVNSPKNIQNGVQVSNNDVKSLKPKQQALEELKRSLQYAMVYTEGGKRDYPPELKQRMLNDLRRVQAIDNRITINDFCQCDGTPSSATLTGWMKSEQCTCPDCQEKDFEIMRLKAKLEVYQGIIEEPQTPSLLKKSSKTSASRK